MNQLAFQPAFDVFHTEFRFLRLRRIMGADFVWHYDQLRIADFYLLFFFRLKDARLSPKHRSIRKLAKQISGPSYENQPDDNLLFNRMEPIQKAAAGTLIANGYFDPEEFKRDMMVETGYAEPEAIARRIEEINSDQMAIMQSLLAIVGDYELLGSDGLKARTGLLEYRYDAV